MNFPPYPRYKDTGIEWLGDVPEHWTLKKFKYLFKPSEERNADRIVGEMLSVSGYRGIVIREYDDENQKRTEENLRDYRVVRPGQLVVNTMWLNYAGIGVSKYEGHVSPAYRSYYVSEEINGCYAHHLLRSSVYVSGYTKYLQGIRPNSLQIRTEEFHSFPILLPPVEEQAAIGNFLDRETVKIDILIAKQERLIELLREKRQSIVKRAVTKGLNTSASMKGSGSEWLGEIPRDWSIKKLRYVTTVLRGKFTHRPRNDPAFYDGEHPFIQTGDISAANKFITGYHQTLNDKGFAVSKEFPAGTLVMSIAANIGDVAILDFSACFPDSVVGFVPRNGVQICWLYYALQATKSEMLKTATMNTQLNLNIDRIGDLILAVPPSQEQEAIFTFLDQLHDNVNALISKAQRAIELLKEHRTALISAAVTGKIDVRQHTD